MVLPEAVENDKAALTQASRDGFIRLLNATPNGVIRNSDVAKGVVETSLNVGVVTMTDDNVQIHCLIRSLIDSGKDYVVSMLESLGKLAGRKPKPKALTPLAAGRQLAGNARCARLTSVCSTKRRTSRSSTPVWNAVCSKTVSGDGHGLHRANHYRSALPDEQVHIESVGQYWTLLTELLKAIPAK